MKYLALIFAIGTFALPSFAFALSLNPSAGTIEDNGDPTTSNMLEVNRAAVEDAVNAGDTYYQVETPSFYHSNFLTGSSVVGSGYFGGSTGWDVADWEEEGTYTLIECATDVDVICASPLNTATFELSHYSAPPTDGSISDFISLAQDKFEDQLGFPMPSVLDWLSSILLLWIGMGLALLDAMKFWIVALIAIGVIIFFVFKGLRFFGASR